VRIFFALLLLVIAAYGQQERIAIIQTLDDRDSIGFSELSYLTDRLREMAVNILPKQRYGIMTTESIVAFLGSQERAIKTCKEASCLAELGRKVNADYVAQARIGRFGNTLTIKTELYDSRKGNLMGSFTGSSKDIYGLLALIDEKAADALFKKMPGILGGISDVETAADFGILEIKPAYSDSIGQNEGWSLLINNKPQSSYRNKLSLGNYEVKLEHRCYENISFKVGINKGSNEVFDMFAHIKLKNGDLILKAERNGEPLSEPVYVNGKQLGETPFSGTVPLCAEIELGKSRERVNVVLKYNEKVTHTVKNYGYKYSASAITAVATAAVSSAFSFKDTRDNKTYKITKIGEQTWMAENLHYNASGRNAIIIRIATAKSMGDFTIGTRLRRLAQAAGIYLAMLNGMF